MYHANHQAVTALQQDTNIRSNIFLESPGCRYLEPASGACLAVAASLAYKHVTDHNMRTKEE